MDIVDSKTRSKMMASIRGKNTKPELMLRKQLFALGFRYRLHEKLPGKPDILLRKYRAAIFVHGCFWHRHHGCRYATTPKTRPEFWKAKFESNVTRDHQNKNELLKLGWRVAIVWECGIKHTPDICAETVASWLRSDLDTLEFPQTGNPNSGTMVRAVRTVSH